MKKRTRLTICSQRLLQKLKPEKAVFFTRQRDILDALDPVAANYIRSQAEITHQSPVQIIGDLVRKELQSA